MQGKVRNSTTAAAVSLAAVLLAGCAGLPPVETREYDARFGDAVRQARAQQTLNPEAGRSTDPVSGIDGVAACQAGVNRPATAFQQGLRLGRTLVLGWDEGRATTTAYPQILPATIYKYRASPWRKCVMHGL